MGSEISGLLSWQSGSQTVQAAAIASGSDIYGTIVLIKSYGQAQEGQGNKYILFTVRWPDRGSE